MSNTPTKYKQALQVMRNFSQAFFGGDTITWEIFLNTVLPPLYLISLNAAKGDKEKAEEMTGEITLAIVKAINEAKVLRYN